MVVPWTMAQSIRSSRRQHAARPQLFAHRTVNQFGDTPDLIRELTQLVLSGTKTATCSALWELETESEELPTVGSKTITLDENDQPVCIFETTEVIIQPFDQVDAQFAYDEGEGDRTLEIWRQEHWTYFSRVLPTIGKEPSPTMMLVCERFRVIYPSNPYEQDPHSS
ncbi:MAG: ASCH domain-containing protein [Leptolyngbyaceae bacterium]|nr:ASCH domain-containing protein [Leptolyngbyaceae bacterium]